jgi:hypothetical protein
VSEATEAADVQWYEVSGPGRVAVDRATGAVIRFEPYESTEDEERYV